MLVFAMLNRWDFENLIVAYMVRQFHAYRYMTSFNGVICCYDINVFIIAIEIIITFNLLTYYHHHYITSNCHNQ